MTEGCARTTEKNARIREESAKMLDKGGLAVWTPIDSPAVAGLVGLDCRRQARGESLIMGYR